MKLYRIVYEGEYVVAAESEEDAEAIFRTEDLSDSIVLIDELEEVEKDE